MPTLYYIHDPMCSWCWGFQPTWQKLKNILPSNIVIQYLLGGLAVDCDDLMPLTMQKSIKQTWVTIQSEIPNTKFNFDFWSDNKPKRSTYPACRAVIAARKLDPNLHNKMIESIQHAYYLHAKNPSNTNILIELAQNLNIDTNEFEKLLLSPEINMELNKEINLSRELGAQGFPSLILETNNDNYFIPINYNDENEILDTILRHLNESHQ